MDEKTRKRLSIRRKHDGEFWMSFQDFYKEFDVMEVCHISPDTYDGKYHKHNLEKYSLTGDQGCFSSAGFS